MCRSEMTKVNDRNVTATATTATATTVTESNSGQLKRISSSPLKRIKIEHPLDIDDTCSNDAFVFPKQETKSTAITNVVVSATKTPTKAVK